MHRPLTDAYSLARWVPGPHEADEGSRDGERGEGRLRQARKPREPGADQSAAAKGGLATAVGGPCRSGSRPVCGAARRRRAGRRRAGRLVRPRAAHGRRLGHGLRRRRPHLGAGLRPGRRGRDHRRPDARPCVGFLGGAVVYVAANVALARRGARHRKRSGDQQPTRGRAGRAAARRSRSAPCSTASPSRSSSASRCSAARGVGVPVLAAIFISNLPEGLSSAAGMKRSGRSAALRLRRLGRHRGRQRLRRAARLPCCSTAPSAEPSR